MGVLDRVPDQSGIRYWVDRVMSGTEIKTVAEGFLNLSSHFKDIAQSDDVSFVDQLYLNVLDRSPDAAGQNFWLNALRDGASRADLLLGFINSEEFVISNQAKVEIAIDYIGLLGRSPDESGFRYWVDQVQAGVPELQIIGGFLSSTEYLDRFQA